MVQIELNKTGMNNIKKLIKIPHLVILSMKLKFYGVKYGKKLRGNRVYIKNSGTIIIGDRVSLNSYPGGELYKTGLQAHCKDAKIVISSNCILNGTMVHCRELVVIEDYCLFGPGTVICDNDSHRVSIDILKRREPPNSAPIIIRKNVWIGMNSLILKGVTIGENSIIAAHSVVTKDIPRNTLAGGNPAIIIKTLTV